MSCPGHARTETQSAQWISIVDLDRCNGCPGKAVPACVAACRACHAEDFPNPVKPIRPYWPQNKMEDFSTKRDDISRLSPYNWLFIQRIEVGDKVLFAPRRCMHCFDAPCRKLCPFGAIEKTREGAVKIDPQVCFGGAKCRDICPWGIPQRQAGVGLYLKVAPKFAGGGVMFKCDFCSSNLAKGQAPSCATACPQKALPFMPLAELKAREKELIGNRYVYGRDENGGTATWYVSSTPFKDIAHALRDSNSTGPGRPHFDTTGRTLQDSPLLNSVLLVPIVAAGAAYALRRKKEKPL